MSPNDFSGSERQIFVFDSGQSSVNATEQCLNLTIHDDSTLEDDETFQVHLESTLSTVLLNPSQKSAIITILDDDCNIPLLLVSMCIIPIFFQI